MNWPVNRGSVALSRDDLPAALTIAASYREGGTGWGANQGLGSVRHVRTDTVPSPMPGRYPVDHNGNQIPSRAQVEGREHSSLEMRRLVTYDGRGQADAREGPCPRGSRL